MLPASCTLQGGREVVDSCLLVHEDPREIWRGTWGSKVVASKVLKIQNAAYSKDMEVRYIYHPQSPHQADSSLVAIVRGDGQLEVLEAQELIASIRCLSRQRTAPPRLALDDEWQYSCLRQKQSQLQSIQNGK